MKKRALERRTLGVVLMLGASISVVGCSSGDGGGGGKGGSGAGVCIPGASVACICTSSASGAQVCLSDASGYGLCVCGGSAGTGGNSGAAGGSGTAGGGGSAAVTGTAGGGGSPTGGTSGVGGIAGAMGIAGSSGGSSGGAGAGCTGGGQTQIIPTVLILVDRSGSEFDSATAGTFFILRPAVESLVMQLQGQVRFGLATFVGDHASGACALNYQSVPIALNNYAAIQAAYDGWGPLLPYGTKADGPAVAAIPMVKAALQADSGTGPKYMLLVSNGQSDFCDDGNAFCPSDAVTHEIQDMFAATPSIGTLVMGLPTALSSISAAVLQDFANAGAGLPAAIPPIGGVNTVSDIYNLCSGAGTAAGSYAWMSLYTAAGKTGSTSLATYAATGGTATVFTTSPASETALENQIATLACKP